MKTIKKIISVLLCTAILGGTLAGCGAKTYPQMTADGETAKPAVGDTVAVLNIKDYGAVKVMFFRDQAPKAVENFVTHAAEGYYDGLTFHRVISDFMIQGGDPDGSGMGGESIWGEPFEDEFSDELFNFTGALSMANSGADTNGSQFFIVNAPSYDIKDEVKSITDYNKTATKDKTVDIPAYGKYSDEVNARYKNVGGTPWLDGKHTVFGQVYEGLDIVEKIMETPVGQSDDPLTPVVIESVKLEIVE